MSFFSFFWLTPGKPTRAGRVFQLVSSDAIGIAHPLPPHLGPLPLYPLDDGYYSVLGPPLGRANESTNDSLDYNRTGIGITVTLTPPKDKVFCRSSKCSGNTFASPSTVRLSFTSTNHKKRSTHLFLSLLQTPGCTRPTSFKTKQALNRHFEVIHLAERIDCPFPGCENVGEKGIKRYDNLVVHMRNKHGVSPAGGASRE